MKPLRWPFRMPDGARRMFWPVTLMWGPKDSSTWFRAHSVERGAEYAPAGQESCGCMPGIRVVRGWTFHLGRLKVVFGRDLPKRDHRWCYERAKQLIAEGHRAVGIDMLGCYGAGVADSIEDPREFDRWLETMRSDGVSARRIEQIWARRVRKDVGPQQWISPGGQA